MEDQAATKAIVAIVPPPTKRLTKRRGPMSFLRAAMIMVRRNPNKKQAPVAVDVASNAIKLVGSMRPLHLPESNSPPPPPPRIHASFSMDSFHDVFPPPMSPSAASCSGSSIDGMSRYASAQNLQELDRSNDDDVWGDGGDEMIDIKAKEFIAQFYARMRLERLDSFNRAMD